MVTWWLWLVLGGMGGGMGPPLGFFINLLVIWLVLELASESGAKIGEEKVIVRFLCHLKKLAFYFAFICASINCQTYSLCRSLFVKKTFFLLLEKTFKQFSRYVNFKGLCPTKLDGWNFIVLVNSGINKQFIMNKK